MTLIAVYTSEGYIGRCDAKCYTATVPTCDCICGGANHEVLLQKLIGARGEVGQALVMPPTRTAG
jgi:hypothetical protein